MDKDKEQEMVDENPESHNVAADEQQDEVSVSNKSNKTESIVPFDLDTERWAKDVDPPFTRQKEKIVFTYGVLNFAITTFLIDSHPWFLPWWYTFKFPFYIFGRFFYYRTRSWHWFLMDFCYLANTLLIINIWAWPDERFFSVMFALTNGPLLFAIPVFGNSMVFHSVDHIISLYIHLTPAVITYTIRHNNDLMRYPHELFEDSEYFGGLYKVAPNDSSSANFLWLLAVPMLIYWGHQIIYFILVQGVFKKTIENDKKALTTYRYIFRHRSGLLYRMISMFGDSCRVFVFGIFQLCFCSIVLLPTYLLYRHKWLHMLMIGICCSFAVWNGASFYVEVFKKTGVKEVIAEVRKIKQANAEV